MTYTILCIGIGRCQLRCYACIEDNRWNSHKLCTEKSTIGNEPYIKGVTVLGGSFVL